METGRMTCAAALCAALIGATPAGAGTCWSGEQAEAATVRDLQSKLMVATMRCHAMGIDIAPAYNGFVRTNRARLETINGTIKARFAGEYGRDGQHHYDRFTTSLANAYGADGTNGEICRTMAAAAREAEVVAGERGGLLELAERLGVAPRLADGRCAVVPPLQMASAAATAFPQPGGTEKVTLLPRPAPRVMAAAEPTVEPIRPALTLASLGLNTSR